MDDGFRTQYSIIMMKALVGWAAVGGLNYHLGTSAPPVYHCESPNNPDRT